MNAFVDRALSVSSSVAQLFASGADKCSHIIDPRTGTPVTHPLAAAVLHEDGVVAEAISTALIVLGPECVEPVRRAFPAATAPRPCHGHHAPQPECPGSPDLRACLMSKLLGLLMVPLKPFREDIPPIHALARWTYDNNQGGAAIFMRTILEQELKKVKGKGIILYGVIGCSFQSINKEMWRDYFHQKGIPSINLEGSFQTGAPTGQLMTRVRAFIEMLS